MGVKSSGTLRLQLFLRASPPWRVGATPVLFTIYFIICFIHNFILRMIGCCLYCSEFQVENTCRWHHMLDTYSHGNYPAKCQCRCLEFKHCTCCGWYTACQQTLTHLTCCSWEGWQKGPSQEVGDPATQTHQVPCRRICTFQ